MFSKGQTHAIEIQSGIALRVFRQFVDNIKIKTTVYNRFRNNGETIRISNYQSSLNKLL